MTVLAQGVPESLVYFSLKEGAPNAWDIAPGSAVVGYPKDGRWVLYYEGNVNNACNLTTFEDRVRCAAGRCFARYPTIALISLSDADVKEGLVPCGTIGTDYWLDRSGIDVKFEGDTKRDHNLRIWLYGLLSAESTPVVTVRHGNTSKECFEPGKASLFHVDDGRRVVSSRSADGAYELVFDPPGPEFIRKPAKP